MNCANMKYIVLIASVLLGAAGQVLMKWGVDSIRPAEGPALSFSRIASAWPILAGLASYAVSSVFWLFALKRFPISTAYPMVSAGYIIVLLCGYFLFHEHISVQKWFGIAFICAGVLLISRS